MLASFFDCFRYHRSKVTAASTGTVGIAIGVAGVGAETAAGVGTVGLNIAVAGTAQSTAASVGSVGLAISVAGVGAEAAAGVGSIGLNIAVAGVGQGTSPGAAVGSIGLNIDVEGVGAANTNAIGTIGIEIDVNGVTPITIFDRGDPGLRKKKRWEEEADAKRRQRERIIDAYERIVEERPDRAKEIAAPFLPKKPKYLRTQYELPKQAIIRMASDEDAARKIWEAYLEMDDEEAIRWLA